MPSQTHYDVLEVAPDASTATIRAAYRRLARVHHPDRAVTGSAALGGRTMPALNEAYRVLNDPGRRAIYDKTLRPGAGRDTAAGTTAGTTRTPTSATTRDTYQAAGYRHDGPARVPWRMALFCGLIAIVGIVVLAQFTDPGDPPGPDGILRGGDCVEILANTDAREVACTGTDDRVVEMLVPFDGVCPGHTEPHRDRQGMGVACVQRLDGLLRGG